MHFKNTLLSTALTLILTLAGSASVCAQQPAYRLPGQHSAEHRDLMASQTSVTEEIKVQNTKKFLDTYFAEEEEPEMDIYTEGWNSGHINCYDLSKVPQTHKINVADFSMPCPGYITSPYGYRARFRRQHKGVDLKLQTGDTVFAAFDGRVRIVNYERRGYGNYVVIRHDNDLETVYGHLSAWLVKPGDVVRAGDPIALGGSTGRSTGPHLHFETRYMGYAINPCAIFDFANQTVHTDTYTFDKRTYTQARDFSPASIQEHQRRYTAMRNGQAVEGAEEGEYILPGINNHASKSSSSSRRSHASSGRTVKVKRGDSLSRIAARNGTTVRQLCRLNGLSTTSRLQPGQKLKVR